MTSDAPARPEPTEKEEMLFSLHHRDKPTLAFVECKTNAKRDELAAWLQQELTEYRFYTIDVTPLTVASLLRTLDDKLPADVKHSPPVTCVVNVYGLENRLDEQLAAQLNLERELLFRNVPYITLIWADAYFFRKLQRLAPDLWHWVTYKFRFDDLAVQAVAQLPPLPPRRLEQRGDIEARRERIRELEERYSHLDLSDRDKLRLLRDKLNTKSLLADEYAEAFEYAKAIAAYCDALGLETHVSTGFETKSQLKSTTIDFQNTLTRGNLLLRLALAYLKNHLFDESLVTYCQSKELLPESFYGSIYHGIGMVHAAQRQWKLALDNYEQALYWEEQTKNTAKRGDTYHQIGIVYAEQEQWAAALESYERAITSWIQNGRTSKLGGTYHQIGMVYAEQRQWSSALENYELAITWKRQTGNMFEICSTYHQIGIVYTEQGKWEASLENYEQALAWGERTGNSFERNSTYHQIGILYAQQHQWGTALENYQQALIWGRQTGNVFEQAGTYYQIGQLYEDQSKFHEALRWYEQAVFHAAGHPNLPMAERAVTRVQEELRQHFT